MSDEVQLSDYVLVIKVPFQALDDIAAKQKAHTMYVEVEGSKKEVKLQRVFKDKPSIGIQL